MVQVDRERSDRGEELLAAAPILAAAQWGSRPSGSHGDPTSLSAVAAPVLETTWAERAQRLHNRLSWLAKQLG